MPRRWKGSGVSGTNLDAAIRRRGEVSLQEVGREAILHDRRLGKAHVINGSAARIWELCDGRDLESIITTFGGLYGRSADDVR